LTRGKKKVFSEKKKFLEKIFVFSCGPRIFPEFSPSFGENLKTWGGLWDFEVSEKPHFSISDAFRAA